MEKPSFQFGLKAVFVVMTGVAVLLAAVTTFPPDLLGALAVGAILWVSFTVVLVASGFAFSFAIYHALRLSGVVWNKCRAGCGSRPPDA